MEMESQRKEADKAEKGAQKKWEIVYKRRINFHTNTVMKREILMIKLF